MSIEDESVGEAIRRCRLARNKSQAVVAGLAGIDPEYYGQIERGRRTPSLAVLRHIARALETPIAALLGDSAPARQPAGHSALDDVFRAMTVPAPASADPPPEFESLRTDVDEAWSAWQTSKSRYTDVAAVLPGLLARAERALTAREAPGEAAQRREAARSAADLYFLARTFCKRAGRVDLALLAADRSLRHARDGADPGRIAAAHWNLGHALLADPAPGSAELAFAVAVAAAGEIDEVAQSTGDDQPIALYGALQLVAVTAEARIPERAWAARERLHGQALPAARRSRAVNALWTAFSELNVDLHAFHLELEDGDLAEAMHIADRLDPSAAPSIERRLTFLLDLARAGDRRRDDAAVLLYLLEAEREAPEDLRYNAPAHDLVRTLRRRARPTLAPQVGALAARIGLPEG
jgi:transcriptional regulator with XRE-family HTH domain